MANYYIFYFVLYFILMWFIWAYTHEGFMKVYPILINLVIEKDYEFIVSHITDKKTTIVYQKRILNSLLIMLMYTGFNINTYTFNTFFVSVFIGLLVYKIQYSLNKMTFNSKLKEAGKVFPLYLNNLSILVQDNPIPIAILKSTENAPVIFKKDLEILVKEIHEGEKKGVTPYVDFARKFDKVDGIYRTMRTLHNISITSNNREVMITSLSKIANEKISMARKLKLDGTLDKQSLFPWIGFLWISIVLIALFLVVDYGM